MDSSEYTGIMARESPKAGQGCPGLWLLSLTQVPHLPAQRLSCTHRLAQDLSSTQH